MARRMSLTSSNESKSWEIEDTRKMKNELGSWRKGSFKDERRDRRGAQVGQQPFLRIHNREVLTEGLISRLRARKVNLTHERLPSNISSTTNRISSRLVDVS